VLLLVKVAVAVVAADERATLAARVVAPSRKGDRAGKVAGAAAGGHGGCEGDALPKLEGFRLEARVTVVELTAVASPTSSMSSGALAVSPLVPRSMLPGQRIARCGRRKRLRQ